MTLFLNRIYDSDYKPRRIRRIMRIIGIQAVIRKKRKSYVKQNPETVAENILNREFKASRPNEKWLTDVTEFKVIGDTKKYYLSAIYDRLIEASSRMRYRIVIITN